MESKHYFKNVRISPKKLRFLLPEVKKMKPVEALVYLNYTPNKSGKVLYRLISSAVSSAKQVLKVDEGVLEFKTLSVDGAQVIKRYRSGGRGTVHAIGRGSSHVLITLKAPETVAQPKEVKEVKPLPVQKKKK